MTPDNTTPETVEAGNTDGTTLGEKVTNPTDDITGTVTDENGNQIDGAKVTVDPDTGDITVTVPAGTTPGKATVELTDATGEPIAGTIDIEITGKSGSSDGGSTIGDGNSSSEGSIDGSSIGSIGEGSSANEKCVPTLLGWGIPLLALIPLGIATQVSIPGLDGIKAQVNAQVQNINNQLQNQFGLMNPALAAQAEQINNQLRAAGADLGKVLGGLALLGVGIAMIASIAVNCTPGAEDSGSSNGSSEE